jgi:hypothetical protein
MMPLSQVLAYNTEHLIGAAEHWQGLADQREEVFASVRNEAFALPWDGQAAGATHQRTQADHDTAMDSAGNLRQAAMIAKDGASTLDQMHSRVIYTLEDAQADGFAPTEALAFVDTRPSANPAELAQRQAQAQAYTGQVQAQVADLYTHDTQVGADMSNATAGEGKVQFVDHAFKTDGGDKAPHDCSGRENADGGLGILGGVAKTVGGIATTVAGVAVGGVGVAAEGPSAGTSTAIVAGGVGIATTGIAVIADGIKGIIDGIDDLSNCK